MTTLDNRYAAAVEKRDRENAQRDAFLKKFPMTRLICPLCLRGQRRPWKRGELAECRHDVIKVRMEVVPEGMTSKDWVRRMWG